MSTYLGEVRHRLELLHPLCGSQDSLLLLLLPGDVVPVRVGVVEELLHHLWMGGLRDVEQVVSIALPALGVFVWEVLGHVREADQLGVQGLDGDLVVLLDRDHLELAELEELLLAGEDVSDEILGAHLVGWQIVLQKAIMNLARYLPGGDL